MIVIEDHCVGCTDLGKPCIGPHCRNANVAVCYCDECGEKTGCEVYEVDGEDLCEDCLKRRFLKK